MKQWIISALAVGISACSGNGIEAAVCVFDGRYEAAAIPRNGCVGNVETFRAFRERSECSSDIEQVSLQGAIQSGYLSCEPGDPVVQCEGFLNDSDGCSFDVYMRRVGP